jgi:molybdopterin-containing oxidoreductase family membrane subunit
MIIEATKGIIKTLTSGSKTYKLWVSGLSVVIIIGVLLLIRQFDQGLVVTNMRDQVSWGWYIANFTFLVGVAAAAVVLVIPAYLFCLLPLIWEARKDSGILSLGPEFLISRSLSWLGMSWY